MSKPPTKEAELIELIRAIDVPAPERLHARTQTLIAQRGTRAAPDRVRPRVRLGAAAGLLAAAAIVLALVLSSGGGATRFSLRDASALALAPATAAAPPDSSRRQLAAKVDGVAFPYWGERFGWRSTGSRRDRLAGRTVATVFYNDNAGRRIGYAIVAGIPAPQITGGTIRWRSGTPYRLTQIGADHVLAWVRKGHLCIVAGRVSSATLLMLASWHEHGTAA
jgi:hypothetical protein